MEAYLSNEKNYEPHKAIKKLATKVTVWPTIIIKQRNLFICKNHKACAGGDLMKVKYSWSKENSAKYFVWKEPGGPIAWWNLDVRGLCLSLHYVSAILTMCICIHLVTQYLSLLIFLQDDGWANVVASSILRYPDSVDQIAHPVHIQKGDWPKDIDFEGPWNNYSFIADNSNFKVFRLNDRPRYLVVNDSMPVMWWDFETDVSTDIFICWLLNLLN